MISFDFEIGEKLCEWHSGKTSATWIAGQAICAGSAIPLELTREALTDLKQYKVELLANPENLSNPLFLKDLAELDSLTTELEFKMLKV
jgi:hypothetical protein